MVDLLLVFLLFFLIQWTSMGWKASKKKQVSADKAYIRELKRELTHFQSNSAFVVRTLLEREVGRVEEAVAQQKPTTTVPWTNRVVEILIQIFVGAFIISLWWNTTLYSFSPVPTATDVLVCERSDDATVECTTGENESFFTTDSVAMQAMFYLLRTPQSAPGVVGIVGWSIVCRMVAGLILS